MNPTPPDPKPIEVARRILKIIRREQINVAHGGGDQPGEFDPSDIADAARELLAHYGLDEASDRLCTRLLHEARNFNEYDFYHVTLDADAKSILENGLQPGTGDRSSQVEGDGNRVYLFRSQDDAEDAVMNWLGDEFPEDEPLALFGIRLPEGFPVEETKGAEYEWSTTSAIPPEYLFILDSNF